MKKVTTKTAVFIISVIVTAGLIIGYETFRLSSVLKEKKELKMQFVELSKEKKALEDNLAKINSELKIQKDRLSPLEEGLSYTQRSLEDKALQEIKLKKQLAKAQSYAQKSKNKIKELNDILKLTKSENSSLEKTNQVKDLQDKLLEKDAQIKELSSLKDSLAKQSEEANAKLAALSRANDFLEKQIEVFQNEIIPLKEELNKAAALNVSLQQGLTGPSQSAVQEAQSGEKAGGLKKNVEVILTPQKN